MPRTRGGLPRAQCRCGRHDAVVVDRVPGEILFCRGWHALHVSRGETLVLVLAFVGPHGLCEPAAQASNHLWCVLPHLLFTGLCDTPRVFLGPSPLVWMMNAPVRAAVLPHPLCRHPVPATVEFTKIASATAIGFAVMGFIGYFVRLLHIPVNNILIGMCCSPGCSCLVLHAPRLVVTHFGSSLNA